MAAENWSFTPALDSSKITTAETDGKLVITVKPNVFTTDTQYTVKYDDGNGCTASTIFYIKENCSGGGGGDTGKINVRIVNESGVDTLCFATHSGGNIKVYTTSNPSESYFITIPEGTYIIQRGLPEIFNDCSWQPNGNVQPLPLSSEAKIYAPDQTGGPNSGVITIVNETTGSKMSDLREITLKVTSVQEDSGGNYMKCSNTCTIANKTIAADVTGSVEIASLPSLGTWSFSPDSTSWLGAIQQYGTSNRVIAQSAQQIPNDMSITITATCTSDECGDCKNNPITFTVTKKGTSSPTEKGIYVRVKNSTGEKIGFNKIKIYVITENSRYGNPLANDYSPHCGDVAWLDSTGQETEFSTVCLGNGNTSDRIFLSAAGCAEYFGTDELYFCPINGGHRAICLYDFDMHNSDHLLADPFGTFVPSNPNDKSNWERLVYGNEYLLEVKSIQKTGTDPRTTPYNC